MTLSIKDVIRAFVPDALFITTYQQHQFYVSCIDGNKKVSDLFEILKILANDGFLTMKVTTHNIRHHITHLSFTFEELQQ